MRTFEKEYPVMERLAQRREQGPDQRRDLWGVVRQICKDLQTILHKLHTLVISVGVRREDALEHGNKEGLEVWVELWRLLDAFQQRGDGRAALHSREGSLLLAFLPVLSKGKADEMVCQPLAQLATH